ncbi:MAG: polysaccharide deacetylase family protein [Chitinophagaceae bacterium]
MIVFSPNITPRLRYSCNFIGKELTGDEPLLTASRDEFILYDGPRINYSHARVTQDEFWIKPHSLLFEKGIQPQAIDCAEWNFHKIFFKTSGEAPFDIFAAVFYLLSRYEEYLPHEKDACGRFDYKASLAYRENFLELPVINTWLQQLKVLLRNKFPGYEFLANRFTFLPTYDIDEASSFKYKQWWRSAGAALKDLVRGHFARLALRRRVLNGTVPDPFDSFAWIDDLHRPYKLHPRYFFLVPAKTGKYDRNILPDQTALQSLIRHHAEKYIVGVHPSWQSGDDHSLIKSEKETIEKITGIKVTASRQHYIRMTLPHTYRYLINAGITEDYSMGYGSINGFRASVASPFYWYDLEKEQQTHLLLFPFCYMDANSFFEQKLSPVQAIDEIYHYYNEVRKVNGTLVTIWHNTFLGTDRLFEGWREVYVQFFKEAARH